MGRIRDLLNDPSDSQWSEAQKLDRLQEAQEQFVEDTRALTDTQSFSIVDGTRNYALDTSTLDILRVSLNGVMLRRVGKFDLDLNTGINWSITTGTPTKYYVDYTSTNKNLVVYPIPTSNDAGTDNLLVEYVKVPPELSSGSSQPLNDQVLFRPYLSGLAYHAAAQLLFADNDPQKWAKAKTLLALYQERVDTCVNTFKALAETMPMRMRGGRYFKGL